MQSGPGEGRQKSHGKFDGEVTPNPHPSPSSGGNRGARNRTAVVCTNGANTKDASNRVCASEEVSFSYHTVVTAWPPRSLEMRGSQMNRARVLNRSL